MTVLRDQKGLVLTEESGSLYQFYIIQSPEINMLIIIFYLRLL